MKWAKSLKILKSSINWFEILSMMGTIRELVSPALFPFYGLGVYSSPARDFSVYNI